jgi:hypothetical protein
MHPTGGVTIYPNAWAYVYGSVVDDSLVAHQHRQHRHADQRQHERGGDARWPGSPRLATLPASEHTRT